MSFEVHITYLTWSHLTTPTDLASESRLVIESLLILGFQTSNIIFSHGSVQLKLCTARGATILLVLLELCD